MKIIDCFIFYNELDLLTYRLNLLNNIVPWSLNVRFSNSPVYSAKCQQF